MILLFSIYDGTVSFYYTVGIVDTETYEGLLCSRFGRHENMSPKDNQVSLSSITIINVRLKTRVSVSFEMSWFNLEPDMISPESLDFSID